MKVCNMTAESRFDLVNQDEDAEIRPGPEVVSHKQEVKTATPFSDRFSRFSSWNRLVRTIARIKNWACRNRKNGNSDHPFDEPQRLRDSELSIIECVQGETYKDEMKNLKESCRIPHNNTIKSLSPAVDSHEILRVGGRLNKIENAVISMQERSPIILPKDNHVTCLIIGHFHLKVCHQGRHFTESAVRSAGYWVGGLERIVSSLISKCVICRKLRRKFNHQKMADLSEDRCRPSPPFSYVAVDTFGPW